MTISTPAKIIDFGIAKDLEASSATIVGDGFAGKLNYVAPEQLGDFGREIGPWTDVYSLGLVILAVAQGKNVDMSGSLVDAIDKRRRGPDLSPIPDSLRPLLEAMLRPNPQERLRSMEAVLAMLDGARVPGPTTVRESLPPEPPPGDDLSTPKAGGRSNTPDHRCGVIGLIVALAAGEAWYATGGDLGLDGWGTDNGTANGAANEVAAPLNRAPAETARAAIDAALPSVPCTWLDIGGIAEGDPLTVAMRGVAGNAGSAQAEIGRALANAGLANVRLEFRDVATIAAGGCAALDSLRQFRDGGAPRLAVTHPRFEMVTQADGQYAGRAAANAVIDLNADDQSLDFTLLGIEPSGAITQVLEDRGQFQEALAQSVAGRPISDEGNGRYRLHLDLDHQGWSGVLLIAGRGPFPRALVAPELGARGPDWRDRFVAAAGNQGWQTRNDLVRIGEPRGRRDHGRGRQGINRDCPYLFLLHLVAELALIGLAELLGEDLHEGFVRFLLHRDELALVMAPQSGVARARQDPAQYADIFAAPAPDRAGRKAVQRRPQRAGNRLQGGDLVRLQVDEGVLDRLVRRHEAGRGWAQQLRQRLLGRARELDRIVALELEAGHLGAHLRLGPRPRLDHDQQAGDEPLQQAAHLRHQLRAARDLGVAERRRIDQLLDDALDRGQVGDRRRGVPSRRSRRAPNRPC